MNTEILTAMLAEQVMGWVPASDRFLLGDRKWLPRWRFQPLTRLADALRLLEHGAPRDYSMGAAKGGHFWVKVRIGDKTGQASEATQARAISFAVARAFGIEPGVEP